MKDLSVIIPARNEEFLSRTIEDILKNIEADTEVIAVLDGEWADPSIPKHDRVNVIYLPEASGQRAATNIGVRLSKAKYVMKVDAHCAFDKGFDRKMIEAFEKVGDKVTMVPVMRNLWVYDWVCPKCKERLYQDKVPSCPKCGGDMEKEMLWIPKPRPKSTSYCFDSAPKFNYFGAWKRTKQYKESKKKTGLTETMSLQGSCFMCTRRQYLRLNLSAASLGSWGNQGVEVACKTWLSGGRVLVNHKTWYAHLFRTKAGVFGFPWPVSGRAQMNTKKKVRDLFWDGKWSKQILPVSWLVEKFWPVKGWTDDDLAKLKKHEASHPLKSS